MLTCRSATRVSLFCKVVFDRRLSHSILGGPNAEVSSYAWQVALNTTTGALFQGLQDFDFLGESIQMAELRATLILTHNHSYR